MRVCTGQYAIDSRPIESSNALKSLLDSEYKDNHLLLEGDAEMACLVLEIQHLGSPQRKFAIGVIEEVGGAPLVLLPTPETESILIACNQSVTRVSLGEQKAVYTNPVDLGMPVNAMVRFSGDRVLVIGEIGAAMLDANGQTVWLFTRDLVVDYELTESSLLLKHSDAPAARIDLETGEPV